MTSLSFRERMTIIAALHYWRDEITPHSGGTQNLAVELFPEQFDSNVNIPLEAREIDDLCERLEAQE